MNQLTKSIILIILLVFSYVSCSKEKMIIETTFSDKLIGTWELRETLNFSSFLDEEFHELSLPYWSVSFSLDSSYVYDRQIYGEELGVYEVNEMDSTVIFMERLTYGWKMRELINDTMIVDYGSGREGPRMDKFVKIE